MKRILILFIILGSFITAKAQLGIGGGSSIVGKVSGTLIDSVTKQPLSYASVALFRATGKSPINGVLTDDKGQFKIDGVHPGDYKIRITYVGYPEKFVGGVTTTNSKPDKNMGSILVAPSAKILKGVSVTAQAPLIENKIDKIVYNAEKDLTATGGNATDVLQKVPLVAVDINGNVSLRGDQNVRVLINGKPSGATSASLSDVLKTIPADQIKSIEVITSPSAKYDAEGSAGIINIITKQKNMSGISGSVSGGIGTRQNNGNFNLNYNKNRFSLSMNAGGNYTWPQTSLTTFYNDIQPNNAVHTSTSSSGTNYVKRYGAIGNVSANYEFNAFNDLHTNIRLNQGGFNTVANSTSNFTNLIPDSTGVLAHNTYSTNALGHNSFGGFDWNLDYTHKFHKEGEELDLSTQWSHSRTVTDFTSYYHDNAQLPNSKANINGLNNEYTLQADYTLPINKVFKLEAGGKEILRRLVGTQDAFVYDSAAGTAGDFVFDNANSAVYNYNQDVTAGYGVLTITLPKGFTLMLGARDEVTNISGAPQTASSDTTLRPFSNSYNTFIPSFTIQKALSSTQTIKLAYSKRITRPGLTSLNPYDNKTNILAQTEGNPYLAPEVSQTLEFDYITFVKSSVINMSVYYKHTSGLIETIAEPIPIQVDSAHSQPGTLTTPHNIGNNNSFGTSFFGSVSPIRNVTLRANINAYTYKPDPSGLFLRDQTQNGTYVQYSGFAMAEWDLKSGFIAQVFTFGSSPRHTIQGTNPSFSILGMGVRQQFMKKKASLGINVLEPFNKYKYFNSQLTSPGFTQNSTFAFPFRSVGLTFQYSFGKTTFSPEKNKINNDDIKQDQGGMPGGAGGGAGGGGGGNR
ncbi:MAG TPA: outer membrane beta-barrel family protein [Mucilaginibacter sp.]|nr:outer membrane beta-barrel family protein [Mucilaginibacter sp.]